MPRTTTESFDPTTAAVGFGELERCHHCGYPYSYVSAHGKPTELACGRCGHPVPVTHPEQIRLKREWEEECHEQEDNQRQHRTADHMAQSPGPISPTGAIEAVLAGFERRLAAQEIRIAGLEAGLARQN
jgi:hypothetical protein